MTNWKTVTGKLSPEENNVVEDFIAENNISKNELLLKALRLYIPMMKGVTSLKDKDLPISKDFFAGIDKIMKSKDYQIKTARLYVKLCKKYSPEEVVDFFMRLEEAEKLQKKLESSHAPKGRPKTKRNRGRPKQ